MKIQPLSIHNKRNFKIYSLPDEAAEKKKDFVQACIFIKINFTLIKVILQVKKHHLSIYNNYEILHIINMENIQNNSLVGIKIYFYQQYLIQ